MKSQEVKALSCLLWPHVLVSKHNILLLFIAGWCLSVCVCLFVCVYAGMEIKNVVHRPLWLVDFKIYQPLNVFTSHFLVFNCM